MTKWYRVAVRAPWLLLVILSLIGAAQGVSVAAKDRVGIHAFDHGLVECRPEHAHRQPAVETDLGGGQAHQHRFALTLVEPVEGLAIGFAAIRIGRLDAGAIKLCGC